MNLNDGIFYKSMFGDSGGGGSWADISDKPFDSIGEGLRVDENRVLNTEGISLPSVTIADNGKILKVVNGVWTAVFDGPPMPNYLCFTAEKSNSTISMTKDEEEQAPDVSLETSVNGVDWTPFVVGETTITLANVGDKVYFRGDNESMSDYNKFEDEYYFANSFVMTGKIAASGNVMSLLDKTCESVTIDSKYCFAALFYDCPSLTTAPELPATTLADGCYYDMFSACTLTTVPELPATTLADYCYKHMFMNCSSLTTVSKLPATTLARECYSGMFLNCESLITIPQLPATTLDSDCYTAMFSDCISLYVSDTSGDGYDKALNIPTEGIADYGEMWNMFSNCLGTRSTDSPNFNGVQKTYYTQNTPV